ncbi:hypothetical protein [Achromobacter pestifer]|uniref:Alpha/beta hydrolase n=1 Tax=Achromobacter pestifer TaxID=1353889 RepID=A0A6S6YIX1_9BURK|nr:hypothetical protein [Achromobacter pestifer]CAB3626862.1 hypothetical protein LMG3431_00412 [Achromobacter pestifer]
MTTADTQPLPIAASVRPRGLDLAEIIAKNEITILGKKILYVPLKESTKNQLLIVMSTHNQGTNYLAMRSFLEDQKYDLLFIADPFNTWYLDHDYGEVFSSIFRKYTEEYSPENVFFFGSSMSGYGAVLHALRLNANAIVANPQINLDMTREHSWPELKAHISDLKGKHINIDELAEELWQDSVIYIVHGHLEMDVLNLNLLTNSRLSKKKLIIQTLDIDSHAFPFGREIENVYAATALVSNYRQVLNVNHIEEQFIQRDGHLENKRRKEQQRNRVQHPMLTFEMTHQALWQLRHQYESPGATVFFSNIGLYIGDRLSGAHCTFDGKRWRLLSPIPSAEDNLISIDSCLIDCPQKNLKNDQFINNNWKIRAQETTEIDVSGSIDFLDIQLRKTETNNTFLNFSLLPTVETCISMKGKYLTLSADVYTSAGDALISLGGFSSGGYHHTNSAKATPQRWRTLSALELFPSVDEQHPDRLFVRINVGIDSKPKRVKITNLQLVIGYFPMGLP